MIELGNALAIKDYKNIFITYNNIIVKGFGKGDKYSGKNSPQEIQFLNI